MERLGPLLRAIRERRELTLEQVAKRCESLAIEAGDVSYRLSAGWLSRLERQEHQITIHNLVALAHIYGTQIDHLIRSAHSTVIEDLESSSKNSLIPSAQSAPVTQYGWGIIRDG
jgi:transcriptional regulator with XRE-family HTH domain